MLNALFNAGGHGVDAELLRMLVILVFVQTILLVVLLFRQKPQD
jgi:hypothetical protein